MNHEEIDRYRERLIAMSRRLSSDVASLRDDALTPSGGESTGSISHDPAQPADLGTDLAVQQTNLGLLAHETAQLAHVNAALRRIEEGSYGKCQRCGSAIAPARLDALPYAAYCILCAEMLEQQETDTSGNS